MEFCKTFNARTQDKAGLIIPAVVTIYADRSFTFELKTPPAAVLLKRAAKIAKGSGEPHREKVGTVTSRQVREIAEMKAPDLNAHDVEMVKGQKRTSKRKYFPGYILVRMELTDETWHTVRGTPKITGFVGGDQKPPPISDEEVARMTQQIRDGAEKPKPKILFEEGENVRVVNGPFANFSGFVDEVMSEKEKLRVMVHVFGRATPVVLDYTNVEKS